MRVSRTLHAGVHEKNGRRSRLGPRGARHEGMAGLGFTLSLPPLLFVWFSASWIKPARIHPRRTAKCAVYMLVHADANFPSFSFFLFWALFLIHTVSLSRIIYTHQAKQLASSAPGAGRPLVASCSWLALNSSLSGPRGEEGKAVACPPDRDWVVAWTCLLSCYRDVLVDVSLSPPALSLCECV